MPAVVAVDGTAPLPVAPLAPTHRDVNTGRTGATTDRSMTTSTHHIPPGAYMRRAEVRVVYTTPDVTGR